MSTLSTPSSDAPEPPGPPTLDDDYSPAFAAGALLLTLVLLAALVLASWGLGSL